MMSDEADKPVVKTTEETQEELNRAGEQPPEEPRPTPELSARARAERELWAAANKRRAEEASIPRPGDDPAPKVEAEPEKPAEEAAPAAEAAPAEPPAVEDPEVELVVDGKPVKVKQSQILDAGKRALQKETAADARLEFASKLLREAQERRGEQPSAPADAQQTPAPSKTAASEKSDAQLAEDLQYGTKEQAAAAIAEIRQRTGAVDQKGLQDFVREQLPELIGAQLAFHTAVREAQEKYKDIFADQHLATLFHVQEHRARQAGDARSHAELYAEIGDGIRKHFKLPGPGANPGPTLEEKREVKAATPSVPRAAAARVDPAGSEKPLTPEQHRERALEAMKKSRGQTNSLRK